MTIPAATIAAAPATTPATTSSQADNLGYVPGLTCSVSVRNLEKAKQWYVEVLGFQHLYTMPEIGWSELATAIPGVNIGLSQVENHEVKGSVVLTFGVKDIAHARAQLERHQTRFDGETQTTEGMVKLAGFFDLDGNPFMLYELLKPQN
jgi:catechol 2,3-dioxygenase-like lactoylglutathione lyase family enzyme